MKHVSAKDIIAYMETLHNPVQRNNLMRFFKCKPGDYGYGDEFLGLKNPQTRTIVKQAQDLPITEIPTLLKSKWHEVRLAGFLLLVDKFEKQSKKKLINDSSAARIRDRIVKLYLKYADRANNWDLVDLSVHKIIGSWLLLPTYLGQKNKLSMAMEYKLAVLDELAGSHCLWKQRMSIVCSWRTSAAGDPSFCLRYAEIHLCHPHDLMHKAVGWMLREMGKRVSMELLRDFLFSNIHIMHRTTLRYAIELMPQKEREYWMHL